MADAQELGARPGAHPSLPTTRNISRAPFSSLLLPLVPPPALTCSSALTHRSDRGRAVPHPSSSVKEITRERRQGPHSPSSPFCTATSLKPLIRWLTNFASTSGLVRAQRQHPLGPADACCARAAREKRGGRCSRDQSQADESRPRIMKARRGSSRCSQFPLLGNWVPTYTPKCPDLFARMLGSLVLDVCARNQCCSC